MPNDGTRRGRLIYRPASRDPTPMCGIAGFIDFEHGRGRAELEAVATRMGAAIRHRGPDDGGVWADETNGVALSHRRLSIIDLSPLGHQPMLSACERYVVSFNGEIYNFKDLRGELEARGCAFRGGSDTEVMLAAFSAWGVEQALARLNGMFAFALWDRRERTLTLARDRAGEKPLYYGWLGRSFVFGSELKALRCHPSFSADVDRDALALYMRHNYIPAPHSIFRKVRKLHAGCFLRLGPHAVVGAAPEHLPYWSARQVVDSALRHPLGGDETEILDQLDMQLRRAVKMRMFADVPLGAFLSGGVDSTTVVALMQAQSTRPVRTFTIGFRESGYNEADSASAAARHLGTDHTELYVTPDEARAVIPSLPTLYDEPFADSSQIPTCLVAQLARRHVTVAMSGDAGDELFAGYNRYFLGRRLLRGMRRVPWSIRRVGSRAIGMLSPDRWELLLDRFGHLLPRTLRMRSPGEKMYKLASILTTNSSDAMYRLLVSQVDDPSRLVLAAHEPPTALAESDLGSIADVTLRMMYLDTITYLPDDILVKVDRATMGVSLEGRVPLLDPNVIDFAWRMPLEMKIRDGLGKWALRQVLYRYVPRELIDRPKMGFGVPIGAWLRSELRAWAEDLLDERAMRQDGYLDPSPVRDAWRSHLDGRRNNQYHLWTVLMFQAWLRSAQ